MSPQRLSTVLKKLREEKGLTQEELAKLAGVTKPYVSMIESGDRKRPSLPVLKRLAKALGVPVKTLRGTSSMIVKNVPDREELLRLERIKAWLRKAFPTHEWLGPRYTGTVDPPRMAFYLWGRGTPTHRVVIEEYYLADHAADVLGPLREWGLVAKLQQLRGSKRVVVRERAPLTEEDHLD